VHSPRSGCEVRNPGRWGFFTGARGLATEYAVLSVSVMTPGKGMEKGLDLLQLCCHACNCWNGCRKEVWNKVGLHGPTGFFSPVVVKRRGAWPDGNSAPLGQGFRGRRKFAGRKNKEGFESTIVALKGSISDDKATASSGGFRSSLPRLRERP